MYKIMIIDDSRMILEMSKDLIEAHLTECQVTTVLDPEEGLKILKTDPYQILLLDIVMPKITGIEVLERIKNQEGLDDLFVIMFSSINDSEALAQCFQMGAYDFITKPLEQNEFLARINHAISMSVQGSIIQNNIEELQDMNQQLVTLNSTLKEAQSELIQKERLASVGTLAAGMAHEINNPLGFLKSNITTLESNTKGLMALYDALRNMVLQTEADTDLVEAIEALEGEHNYGFIKEDHAELTTDIDHGLDRIEAIVEALRKFSIIDSGAEVEVIDLNESFQNIMTMYHGTYMERIDVKYALNTDKTIVTNRADFNLSLLSLLANAIEAINKKGVLDQGRIAIEGCDDGSFIYLKIIDNGIGMSQEVLSHAMDPFYTTKDVGEGVGLGLTTAYNCFVKMMKGSIQIESQPDQGTTVLVTLPIASV